MRSRSVTYRYFIPSNGPRNWGVWRARGTNTAFWHYANPPAWVTPIYGSEKETAAQPNRFEVTELWCRLKGVEVRGEP